MKKNDVLISEKLKGILQISSITIPHSIKFNIEFTEHYLILKLLDISRKEKTKIKVIDSHVLRPLYSEFSNVYQINYSLIKTATVIDLNNISLLIYNTTTSTTFSMTLKSIEAIGMLFNKKLSYEAINNINRKLLSLINFEVKFLIEQFLVLFSLLRDCLDPKKCENPIIEEILLKAYINGKAYYDKYMGELRKNFKIKQAVKQSVKEKLSEITKAMNNQYDNCSDCAYSEQDNSSLDNNSPYNSHNNSNNNTPITNNNNPNDRGNNALFSQFATFDSLINEFKLKTSVYIEETIILFFQVVSIDHSNKNFKNIDKASITHSLKTLNETEKRGKSRYIAKTAHRSANFITKQENKQHEFFTSLNNNFSNNNNENFSESTKTTSEKKKMNNSFSKRKIDPNNDLLETPKFCDRTKVIHKNNETSQNTMSLSTIMKHMDESKKTHTFIPPTDTYNIFFNTSEIIHRKFFEIFFEEFIGKIFSCERDKDNLMKLDSLYNYFIYLRGLKNILFIEKNRIYFSNVFFMDDDDEN